MSQDRHVGILIFFYDLLVFVLFELSCFIKLVCFALLGMNYWFVEWFVLPSSLYARPLESIGFLLFS